MERIDADAAPASSDPSRVAPSTLPTFSVVDIETSGLSTRRHRILQIAVVRVEPTGVSEPWVSLIKLRWPWQRVGPRQVHGIDRRMLRAAPTAGHVLTELGRRLDGTVFVAHNARFDWSFIERASRRHRVDLPSVDRLCTLSLSRRLDSDRLLSHRLADVCERYGVVNARPHDAEFDALATAGVLPHLLTAHGVATSADLDPLYDRR